jgi:succinyl-CoA synthetase alpha subunit
MALRTASLLVAAASGIILVAVVKQALNKKDQNLSFIFLNPKKALSLITESLS